MKSTLFWCQNQTSIPKKERDYKPISLMKIDAKILNKLIAKHIQQYIKRITQHDQMGFIPGMQRYFNITVNLIHIIKMKDKNHIIILIGIKKAFGKIQHPCIIKSLNKISIKEMYFNIGKSIYSNCTANSTLNGESWDFLL